MVRPADSRGTGTVGPSGAGASGSEEPKEPQVPETHAPMTDNAPAQPAGATEQSAAAAKAKAKHDVAAQHLQRTVGVQSPSTSDPAPAEAFQAGHSAGRLVYEHGRDSLSLAYAEATRLAQAGRPVSPGGWLTVRHQGRNIRFDDVQYRSYRDGYSASFRIRDGETDMRYEMSERKGRFSARGRGQLMHDEQRYEIDLQYRGSRSGQFDSSGSSDFEKYAVNGSVRTDGWALTLDESYDLRTERGDVRSVGHGGACHVKRTINNTLQQGKETYRWQGVHTSGSFRTNRSGDYEASSPAEWSARGRVTRNGQAFGEYNVGQQDGLLKIQLKTSDDSVLLDRFRLRQ